MAQAICVSNSGSGTAPVVCRSTSRSSDGACRIFIMPGLFNRDDKGSSGPVFKGSTNQTLSPSDSCTRPRSARQVLSRTNSVSIPITSHCSQCFESLLQLCRGFDHDGMVGGVERHFYFVLIVHSGFDNSLFKTNVY